MHRSGSGILRIAEMEGNGKFRQGGLPYCTQIPPRRDNLFRGRRKSFSLFGGICETAAVYFFALWPFSFFHFGDRQYRTMCGTMRLQPSTHARSWGNFPYCVLLSLLSHISVSFFSRVFFPTFLHLFPSSAAALLSFPSPPPSPPPPAPMI